MRMRMKRFFWRPLDAIVSRLRRRDSEGYATTILYAGGALLTVAILGTAYTMVVIEVDDYAARQIVEFDAQIDAVDAELLRIGSGISRVADLYGALEEQDQRHRLDAHAGEPMQAVTPADCSMDIYVSAHAGDLANLPCASETSRSVWKWMLHTCGFCTPIPVSLVDPAGRYLAELTNQHRPTDYRADARIEDRTERIRQALVEWQRSGRSVEHGLWIEPRFDPAIRQYQLDYTRLLRLPHEEKAILVRSVPLNTLLAAKVPAQTLGTLALVYPNGIVDFSGHLAREPDQHATLEAVASHDPARLRTTWIGTTLYLTRAFPGQRWTWVYPLSTAKIAAGMWREGLTELLPLAALLVCVWSMIVVFNRRVLAPIKRRSRSGRESAIFQQAMVESLPIGFAALRRETRDFVLVNAQSRELLATDRDAILTTLSNRLDRHDFATHPVLVVEMEIVRAGEPRHYEFALRSTLYAGTEILLLAIYDMTARRQTEALLNEAKTTAEEANRAKSDFLAIMSHEIRTPLHGALSNLELLAHASADFRQRERVSVVRQSFGSLLTLLDNALDFSKIDAQLFQPRSTLFSLRTLVEEVVLSSLPLATAQGVRINYSVADDGARAFGDERLMRQVVLNLLHNALKFTPRGRISVSCRRARMPDSRDCVEIDVSDTGLGIASRDLASIFDPFVQSPSSSRTGMLRGTGLGLALCKRICDLLGGEIHVRSTPGVGSTFSLHIPLAWSGTPDTPYDWPASHGRRAVVVLDRADCPNDLVDVLGAAGWPVQVIPAADALAAAAETRGALRVLVASHVPSEAAMPDVHLVVADDGPLHPQIVASGAYIVSAYAFDATRVAWNAIAGDADDALAHIETPSLASVRNDLRAIRVLVADDDTVCRHVLVSQLAALGIDRVDVAADGDEGMNHVMNEDYDLILTDLSMPQADERLFAEALATVALDTPVILTTADIGWEESVRGYRHRIADVLIKPSSMVALCAAINRCFPDDPASARTRHAPPPDQEVARLLATSLSTDWAAVRAAHAAADTTRLMRVLHKMAGALLIVGEEELGRTLRALEQRYGTASAAERDDALSATETLVEAAIARCTAGIESR